MFPLTFLHSAICEEFIGERCRDNFSTSNLTSSLPDQCSDWTESATPRLRMALGFRGHFHLIGGSVWAAPCAGAAPKVFEEPESHSLGSPADSGRPSVSGPWSNTS